MGSRGLYSDVFVLLADDGEVVADHARFAGVRGVLGNRNGPACIGRHRLQLRGDVCCQEVWSEGWRSAAPCPSLHSAATRLRRCNVVRNEWFTS